jgi:ZIP family zinc transporter
MVDLMSLGFVFVAGLITALATGLGALPFFVVDDIGPRWNVALWGFASGIMIAASFMGLVDEGLANGTALEVGVGALAGVVLVVVAHRIIDDTELSPKQYTQADFDKLLLILGILTVHSFPEGVAVGVAFADLGLEGGVTLFGMVVPVLAIFMTVAISVHNVPEGVAVSIPLRSLGVSNARLVWWSVFSSLPQPIGAVVAFSFVRVARAVLPYGFGFAAGAMVYLVLSEFVPEALETGSELAGNGYRELLTGLLVGGLVMVPLLLV